MSSAAGCPEACRAGRRSWISTIAVGLCAGLAAAWWRSAQSYPTGLFDLYPLYWGGRGLIEHGDAYALDAVVPAAHHGYQLAQVGLVYPLPGVLLLLPLSLLPPAAAGCVWVGLLAAAAAGGSWRAGWGPWPLLYYPALVALQMEQAHLAVTLALAALLATNPARRPWLHALLFAAASSKPTLSAPLLAVVLLEHRRDAWRAVAVTAGLWAVAFAVDPGWLASWTATFAGRNAGMVPALPLAAAAPLLWRWRDRTGAAVLVTFLYTPWTHTAVYQAVPLLLGLDRRRAALLSAAGAAYYVTFATVLPQFVAAGVFLVGARVALASTPVRRWVAAAPTYGLWRLVDGASVTTARRWSGRDPST